MEFDFGTTPKRPTRISNLQHRSVKNRCGTRHVFRFQYSARIWCWKQRCFSGCNLWSGRETDRHKAICKFCDTDFWGTDGQNGGKYHLQELAKKVNEQWPENAGHKYVVCTGGEPLLQLDAELINEIN